MKIQEALLKGTQILKDANIEAPVVEAGVILCHMLKCDRSYLYIHGDKSLSENEVNEYLEKVLIRAKGFPVQYITGRQEFMSINFHVTPDVLIPRHDTEILVETVIEHVKGLYSHIPPLTSHLSFSTSHFSSAPQVRILDIGTGSGCIPISLAYYLDNCRITSIDISEGALQVAKINAEEAGVEEKVKFVKKDIFQGLEGLSDEVLFDVIVSNPPYIPSSDIAGLQVEVKEHEPLSALDGGTDGLDFYRIIVENASRHLKRSGLLIFEVGYDQATAVIEIMGKYFTDIGTVKDLSGIERVVRGFLR
jgi:release factor glutamine methyltransferase